MRTSYLPDTDLLLGNFRSAGVARVTVSFRTGEFDTLRITRIAATDGTGARVALRAGPARKVARSVRSLTEDMLDVARFYPPWSLDQIANARLSAGMLEEARHKRAHGERSARRSGPRWSPQYGDHGMLAIDVTEGHLSFRLELNLPACVTERTSFAFAGDV
jgi:hypothetical protein